VAVVAVLIATGWIRHSVGWTAKSTFFHVATRGLTYGRRGWRRWRQLPGGTSVKYILAANMPDGMATAYWLSGAAFVCSCHGHTIGFCPAWAAADKTLSSRVTAGDAAPDVIGDAI